VLSVQVSDSQYDEEALATIPGVSYEFPHGFNDDFSVERFRLPEALFDPNMLRSSGSASTGVAAAGSSLSPSHCVTTAVGK